MVSGSASVTTFRRLVKRRPFIDNMRIFVKGGAGGMGYPKFGGIGGKGGDVYAEAIEDLTLRKMVVKNPSKRFIAESGGNSRVHQILGEKAPDLTVHCPTAVVLLSETGRKLGELNNPGDKVLLAKGGPGGCLQNQFNGQPGQTHTVILDLKLISDVGLVGFPNAGKSSLLKALSRATPKIASFPFTTICPQLGILKYNDHRQISMADLPGLIEGAHRNAGLGHKFLKHFERTKILLFVVDICGFRLSPRSPHRTAFETMVLLNKELELYHDVLLDKPALLAVNKMDTESAEKKFSDLLQEIANIKDITSNWAPELRPKNFIQFDDIMPISAATGHNIDTLKSRIRQVIEFHHEEGQDVNPTIKQIDILLKKEPSVKGV